MRVHSQTAEEVIRSLVTSPSGLSVEEAEQRLREYGFNEITEVRKTSLARRFLSQFTHLLAVLLWVAAFLCFVSEYFHPGEGMLTLGWAIIAVIMINAVFTFVQEYRAERALSALRKLLPFHVKVLRDGGEKEIPAREVVPGDVILLAEGDKVPADARLLESNSLRVNNAPLTGESEAVLRDVRPFDGEITRSPNIVFAGTAVVSGSARAVVFATAMSTEFGRIAHLTSGVEAGLSPLQKEIVRVTRLVATIATVVGAFFFVMGFLIGRDFWSNFIFAIGITVALIPEGMLPTVTLALAMGSQRMARRKALIKTLPSVETLGAVTVICTDKTGTLTQNRMTVVGAWCDNKVMDAAEFSGYTDPLLSRIACICNNARYLDGEYRGDPTEVALLRATRESAGGCETERLGEIPFDSDRKRMTVIALIDGKRLVLTKGAPESILPLCSSLRRNAETVEMNGAAHREVLDAYESLTDRGLRVLAFAYRESDVIPGELMPEEIERDLVFVGLIGLEDPPRPEVRQAIMKCREAGIRVIMITGDGSRTAAAIAREIGLSTGDPVIIEGRELDGMNDLQLSEKLSGKEIIFARMTPKEKMRIVSVLKDEGEVVAVTGDGVNDAPALKRADIGIAMGISGTDVAKEASDMVILDDDFSTIVHAVEEGRAIYDNIRKFITYIFASNIPEAVPYLSYMILRIPLPLTVIQILAVDLGTDMLPALALGAEKPSAEIMKQPPRSVKERLIRPSLVVRAYLFLGLIEAAACMSGFFLVLYGGGWQWGMTLAPQDRLYMQATTACLTAIVITQVGNVFACRSSRESLFSIGFFSNPLVFGGILFEVALQLFIVYHPFGNRVFGTAPLGLEIWLMLLPFSILLVAAEELRKAVVRRTAADRR